MKRFAIHAAVALALGLGLTAALLWLLGGDVTPVAAVAGARAVEKPADAPSNGSSITRYVAVTGTDKGTGASACITPTDPCETVHHAVVQANNGDTVLVAGGVYTIPDPGSGYVVYIVDKSVLIRGGYSTDFSTWDPDTYTTTLDGEGQDTVVWILGDVTPTLESLWVINGDAGLGDGGGIRAWDAHPVISGCHVYNNRAGGGGAGIYIQSGDNARLVGNEVFSNATSALGRGPGVRLENSANVLLASNRIYSNTAGSGGDGGGVYASCSPGCSGLTLADNQIYGNDASQGGGVRIGNITGTRLAGNAIHDNTALSSGGLYLFDCADARLTNNLVADNTIVGVNGAGITLNGSQVRMLHTTVARNTGPSSSQGIYVSGYSTVWMTNTILVDHSEGIEVQLSSTGTLVYTLWGTSTWANNDDWDGAGAITTGTLASNWWEEPGFVDGSGGNYHLGPGSAAIDRALETGVDTDLDGEVRPYGLGPDLGADEYGCSVRVGTTLYPTVQDGIRAATHDELVEVAGTCKGVDLMSSLAFITETLTVRGGYSHDFGAWDADAYPTTLDAVGQGRVVYINGDGAITPTLEWLRLTNGSSSSGGGGGLYSVAAHPTISACHVHGNTTSGYGGGIYVTGSSDAVVANSLIYNNTALSGGGIGVTTSPRVRLARNQIRSNTASNYGGGAYLDSSGNVTLTNNIVADNRLSGSLDGAGIWARNAPNLQMVHATIARNTGGNGQGIYVTSGGSSSAILTNTILVGHIVGIQVAHGADARLRGTLWGDGAWSNGVKFVLGPDGGELSLLHNVTGYPHFVDPDGGDYHVTTDSAALGEGLTTFVTTDIDGESRRDPPTLGADEPYLFVYLPLVLRGY